MKVKVIEVLNANQSLQELFVMPMQPDLAFKLSANSRAIKGVIEDLNVARKKLIEEYQVDVEQPWPEGYKPKKDEKPEVKKEIPEDKLEEVNEKFAKLTEKTVNVDIQKINQGEFQKYGLKNVTPQQLLNMEFMINLKK